MEASLEIHTILSRNSGTSSVAEEQEWVVARHGTAPHPKDASSLKRIGEVLHGDAADLVESDLYNVISESALRRERSVMGS